jgi:hypothetical protein
MTKSITEKPFCRLCYDAEHGLCDDCAEETGACLNCLYYGEGGLCLNHLEDDDGVDMSGDAWSIYLWVHDNNRHWEMVDSQ